MQSEFGEGDLRSVFFLLRKSRIYISGQTQKEGLAGTEVLYWSALAGRKHNAMHSPLPHSSE